jgi:hypothetical protein
MREWLIEAAEAIGAYIFITFAMGAMAGVPLALLMWFLRSLVWT